MARATSALIGRDRELSTLENVLTAARRGAGAVAFIEGEAGIGKTHLAAALGDRARATGVVVLQAVCDVAEQSVPFAPMRRLFNADNIFESESGTRDDTHAPNTQFRVVAAFEALIESRASDEPLVILLDDLQWADDATLLMLRQLAARVNTLALMIVATVRTGVDHPTLHRVMDQLMRTGAAHVVLGPLDDADVVHIAALHLGSEPDDKLLARLRGASGNPLYIKEFLDAFADTPDDTPPAFRQLVTRRLNQMPDAVQEVVRLASLFGATFSVGELAAALGTTPLAITKSLDMLMQAGIIEANDDRLAFRHDLVRDAVYASMPVAVRTALHKEVGQRLHTAGAELLVVARHLERLDGVLQQLVGQRVAGVGVVEGDRRHVIGDVVAEFLVSHSVK